MSRFISLVKTEPALFVGLAQALIAIAMQFGVNLTAAQTGGLLAVTTAVLALIAAAAARPFRVSALTGFVSAAVTLLIAFGVPGVQPGIVSTLNAVIVAVVMLIVRLHVTPVVTLRAKAAAARM